MNGQLEVSACYESYEKNKELHFTDKRGMVRGSFVKSASSSRLASKGGRTQEDATDPRPPAFDFVFSESVIPSLLISPVAIPKENSNGPQYNILTPGCHPRLQMSNLKSDRSSSESRFLYLRRKPKQKRQYQFQGIMREQFLSHQPVSKKQKPKNLQKK